MRIAIALLSVGLLASPALSKDKKPVDPDKKICRSEGATGSLFVKQTCHTAAEWAQIDEADNSNARAALDHGGSNGSNHP